MAVCGEELAESIFSDANSDWRLWVRGLLRNALFNMKVYSKITQTLFFKSLVCQ